MKIIRDKVQVDNLLEKYHIAEHFDTPNLPFVIHQYEKGEYLTRPETLLKDLLFVVSGKVHIYGLHDDGDRTSVRLATCPELLGDVEYSTRAPSTFFTEAFGPTTCIALPLEAHRAELDQDAAFLRLVIASLVQKLYSNTEINQPNVRDRVLFYMRHIYPDHELRGIETATLELKCSRRQLQRVLHQLCEEGSIVQTGKGRYKLLS